MSDQLVLIQKSELRELFRTEFRLELQSFFAEQHSSAIDNQEKSVVYRTREYVKDLLHTTYPTLDKYSELGLLKKHYFGRRVLFREDELSLSLPTLTNLLRGKAATKLKS